METFLNTTFFAVVDQAQLNIKKVMIAKQNIIRTSTDHIEDLFAQNQVKLVKGHGQLTGQNQVTVARCNCASKVINTKKIVLATGSEMTPIPGFEV